MAIVHKILIADNDEMIWADAEMNQHAKNLKLAQDRAKQWAVEIELEKNSIIAGIGFADGVEGSQWKATWKKDKNGSRRFSFKYEN